MPLRSKAQKESFLQARATRHQDRGVGLSDSDLQNALAVETAQRKVAESALHSVEEVLEETKMELDLEKENAASLYKALCIVRCKQQRTHAAKVAALEKAMESLAVVDQLKEEILEEVRIFLIAAGRDEQLSGAFAPVLDGVQEVRLARALVAEHGHDLGVRGRLIAIQVHQSVELFALPGE